MVSKKAEPGLILPKDVSALASQEAMEIGNLKLQIIVLRRENQELREELEGKESPEEEE